MTAVLKTSLVVVCLQVLGFSVAHLGPISRRRTMGFGPVHPHDEFQVHATPIPASSVDLNPFEVARGFFAETLKEFWYILRKDSYTDKAIGATHVFSHQLINGIEVADGDINVNVMDSGVISHGNLVSIVDGPPSVEWRSFYRPTGTGSFTVAMCPTSPLLMSRSLPALIWSFATVCEAYYSPTSPAWLLCLTCRSCRA